jgi:hypothetical protein
MAINRFVVLTTAAMTVTGVVLGSLTRTLTGAIVGGLVGLAASGICVRWVCSKVP